MINYWNRGRRKPVKHRELDEVLEQWLEAALWLIAIGGAVLMFIYVVSGA